MIRTSLFRTRQRDGVNVNVLTSYAYIEKATNRYYSDIPEGRTEGDFNGTFCGRLRCDQTGDIYEIVHVPENAPYTFTEIFPDPNYSINTGSTVFFHKYPAYGGTTVYHRGDIVTYNAKTYICDVDEVQGVAPDIWGWDELLPMVEETEHVYKTLKELYGEGA